MTIKKYILSGVALFLTILSIHAVPAKPGAKKAVRLADGTTKELTLRGDEYFSYLTDEHNTPMVLREGRLVTLTNEEVTATWTALKKQHQEKAGTVGSIRRGARRVGKRSTVTTGTQRGLVILVQYSDVKFVTPNPQQAFQRSFNEVGYHDNGMAGSVRDYFLAQSYGKLEINFDVVGPYTTRNDMAYYGEPAGNSNDRNAILMVTEAIDAAAADVNFSNYDWDKDGEVDQIFIIYAGYAQSQGADENTIWPHESRLQYIGIERKFNGVTLNTYACASELFGDGIHEPIGEMDGIGTACHEFSHCLGIPDMYDTSEGNPNFGMSYWDVMDSGSYLDDSRTPAGYTSYERWFSGWLEPTELKDLTRIKDMKPLATTPEAYILYNEKNKNEFYLLENRQPTGFDAGLFGHGLLILHIDYNESLWAMNAVNATADHQCVTIIPADNEYGMRAVKNYAGDPWPGITKNTALTNLSTPAATLYNANKDGQYLMSKAIDNITEDEQNMTISFVACRPEMDIPAPNEAHVTEGGFAISWPAITGATSYEVELTTMSKAPSSPEKALQHEEDFSKCYSKSAGFSDISSKLSTYGLSGWSGSKLYTSPGYLKVGTSTASGKVGTPTWRVPESHDMTIVMGADVVKADQTVKGTAVITYGNSGDLISECPTQKVDFEVKANEKIVFHYTDVRKDLFWLTITPATQMYLNYLAVYDGIWTEEQLGIGSAAVRRKAKTDPVTFITETNSYTFQDVDADKRFIYRVRAFGEENTFSRWSEEYTFEFPEDVIDGMANEELSVKNEKFAEAVYDLSGRKMLNGLKKGIYIINGKKVVR